MIYSSWPYPNCLNTLKPQKPSDERYSKLFCKGPFKGIITSDLEFSMMGYYGDFHIYSLPWVFPFFNIKDQYLLQLWPHYLLPCLIVSLGCKIVLIRGTWQKFYVFYFTYSHQTIWRDTTLSPSHSFTLLFPCLVSC